MYMCSMLMVFYVGYTSCVELVKLFFHKNVLVSFYASHCWFKVCITVLLELFLSFCFVCYCFGFTVLVDCVI